ncbi:hypothetical protein UA08_05029 [Talaromyces atroroseus]|uniref:Sterigmatocystin biosynthesis monooxygenase stcW n=1 Tax=Talaromyces atroroseus TaxID=1441469 RepID=A0A225B1P1_TALAT|nr:hypothetical protein UA08_05029 [Talaromyces atroroseus]OKL59727.1 hypothetical protein UA08_05029 [Talaromyces atroroseus]
MSWVRHPLELEEHAIDEMPNLKVAVIGAGIAGINAAILLPAKVPGLELVIYEREEDIAGVWHQCTYPGVRCDVPSHVYQSTFAPSREWSQHYATGAEIKAYWSQVAEKYDARKYIKCGHEVLSAQWHEQKSKWEVTVKHLGSTLHEEADFVILATGIFSHPKLPSYPGLSDYDGHVIHSSRWNPDIDLTGAAVAIIGNGSSGIQVLPQLQKIVSRIDHYARSPTWISGNFGVENINPGDAVPDDVQASFADPETYLRYRKEIENRSFSSFGGIMKDGIKSKQAEARFIKLMKDKLGERTDILEAIQPDFPPSCRRLTPGPGYLEAITEPTVEYIRTSIERVTRTGIRTVDGTERSVDAIVCCTGSEKSMAPPFPVIKDGVDLSLAWRPEGSIGFPHTYMGIAAPGFPNLLFINGPQTSAATGTIIFSTEIQLTLAAKILRKAQSQGIRTMMPTVQATEDFRAYCDAYFPRTVLSENCTSWFNGGIKGGRPIANWPGSGSHANMVKREPRWEDWEYSYWSSTGNRFAYFGNGWTLKDQVLDRGGDADMTPYLQVKSVTGDVDLKSYHEAWFEV